MSEHYMSLDSKVVKKSKTRLVVSGNNYELYTYEYPYLYNLPPAKATIESLNSARNEERRNDNLAKARQTIRRTIDCNKEQYGQKTKFITYTFAKNIKTLEEAHEEWGLFCKRANYRWGSLRYLAVVEFQKRGAVHYHVLYFNLPYIKNAKREVAKTWGKGFINIKTIGHVENIGAYVCKYLQKEIIDKRLVGRKAFFCSRGLMRPEEYRDPERIAEMLGTGIIESRAVEEYQSSCYGKIIYQQGTINRKIYAING